MKEVDPVETVLKARSTPEVEYEGDWMGVCDQDPLQLIMEERFRQDEKWGKDRTLENRTWLAILVEEVGEAAKADLDHEPMTRLLGELTQVAAVAVAWIEDLQRRSRR